MMRNPGYNKMEERIETLEKEKQELRETLINIEEQIDEVLQ